MTVKTKAEFMRPRGMTLLEVLMAVALISIAVMGTFTAWMNSQRLQALQREESIVQSAIERYMNDIRSRPFTQMDNPVYPNYDYGANNGVYIRPPGDVIPTYSYTDPITGITYTVQDDMNKYGYSGGDYGGTPNRLLPGKIKLFLGWNGKGAPTDAALRGVKVSKTPFTGGIKYGDRYWAPQENTPEMRIIFINCEDPVEARMGETPTDPSDGIDLNGDGVIEETNPMSVANAAVLAANGGKLEFGDVDATPLFPRYLATPISNGRAYMQNYLSSANLSLYPIAIQVRWWSVAGLPRELTVISFLTNRAGSTAPATN